MPQVTIYATAAGDGWLQSSDAVYANARAGANLARGSATVLRGGQTLQSGTAYIYETFLAFDIPGNVPAGATITGIELRLYLYEDNSSVDFILEARTHPWSTGGLTVADWVAGADLSSKTLLATLDTNGIGATGEYKSFTSTAVLNGWDRANVLEMVIASSRTRAGDAPPSGYPADWEWVVLRAADYSGGTLAPHIIVTYTRFKSAWARGSNILIGGGG